ncbi:UPF0184 protein C9orf16 homolog, partial [Pimephales promelas]|uniref:UPF0184 protein C9orf16 homolog n=1 Tax=Pimephales promelas TaxID=90988 RepID=UPI001955C48D
KAGELDVKSTECVCVCVCVGSEYAAIDSMLDQINSCLDDIEEKNDSLNGKLHELLESNRQARRDFRQQLSDEEHAHPHPPEEDQGSRDTHTRD